MSRLPLGAALLAALTAGFAPAVDAPPPVAREFRGVWVATVGNIDWPSKPGLPADEQKRELLAILDKTKRLGFNAVVFQVRPMADALYESKLEPWSGYLTGEPGKSPGYDPLGLAVLEAHRRGLELHAWFNPYRAASPTAKGELPASHLVKKRPDLAKPYGKHHWLNPTHPEVQAHSLAVFLDVVRRYDVDGIHIDDYFYPYKEKGDDGKVIPFPDDDTWADYQKGGGKLARDDWRRDAVNRFVERMYKETKALKPWVKVGVSPFGIWRPGHPASISGFDQYAELYADARLWLNEGWVDYWTPQLYWPIAKKEQSFPVLLAWWAGENARKRHLWPGVYTGRVTGAEKGWPASEIVAQIEETRREPGSDGAVHFSMKSLMRNSGGVADAVAAAYAEPALAPASPWLGSEGPAAPVLRKGSDKLSWVTTLPHGARFAVARWQEGGAWKTAVAGPDDAGVVAFPAPKVGRLVVTAVSRTGVEGDAAVAE